MSSDHSRRRFLAGTAAAVASGGLAGCLEQTNKISYGVDTVSTASGTRALVSGTYGRAGGIFGGGKAAYVKLRISITPANSSQTTTDTTELFLRPPGTEADFHVEQVIENATADEIEQGSVRVEVVTVESQVTLGQGAD